MDIVIVLVQLIFNNFSVQYNFLEEGKIREVALRKMPWRKHLLLVLNSFPLLFSILLSPPLPFPSPQFSVLGMGGGGEGGGWLPGKLKFPPRAIMEGKEEEGGGEDEE